MNRVKCDYVLHEAQRTAQLPPKRIEKAQNEHLPRRNTEKKNMQITMFKGLLPVNLPDSWFQNAKEVKFANLNGWQAIDFRPSGGKVLKFFVDQSTQPVKQLWKEVENPNKVEWVSAPFAVDSREAVKWYGQSATVLDLKHLG